MDIGEWVTSQGGIVHRSRANSWPEREVRRAVEHGGIQVVRRAWLMTASAPPDLRAAAQSGARVACVSLARARRWWMPDTADPRRHLSRPPKAKSIPIAPGDVMHWSKPVAPSPAHSLHESIEDALAHIAMCLPYEEARTIWESAIRLERLSVAALRRVEWTTRAAARMAEEASDLSDSGVESIFLIRLGPWGLPIRQQVVLAGRRVDFLIGERLVVQVDGHAYHSSAADRARDAAHDAELQLRGFHVLRFTYAQVLHDWPAVERVIARAVAGGLHRSR